MKTYLSGKKCPICSARLEECDPNDCADSVYCPKCVRWLPAASRSDTGAGITKDEDKKTGSEIGGSHYAQGLKVSPWDLQQSMTSSGDAFVDARRCDGIKYAFRMKGDLEKLQQDMEKAVDCLQAGIERLKKIKPQKQPEKHA